MTIEKITKTEITLDPREESVLSEASRIISGLIDEVSKDNCSDKTLYSDEYCFDYSFNFIDKVYNFLNDLTTANDLEVI